MSAKTLETLMPEGLEELADLMALRPDLLAYQILSEFAANPPRHFRITWELAEPKGSMTTPVPYTPQENGKN